MNLETLTPQVVIGIVVAILSLVLDYFPRLAEKFDALDTSRKKLISLGGALLTTVVVYLGQCTGWLTTPMACGDVFAWLDLGYNVIVAVAVMYGFHKATKPEK